ncbi:MAG: DUF4340 domain-containing protein [Myxococcales bacterium]|nr:DUF4340 domain-containing protein [Myxococcales bacterium]
MKELRRLALHIVLLVVAATAAFVKSRPEDASDRPLAPGEVELWSGSSDRVEKVIYEGKTKVVTLERQSDAAGVWFKGHVEPAPEQPEAPGAGGGDGGAPPKPPPPVEPATFVSVEVAEKIGDAVASLRAKRAIGEVGDDRAKAFGLDAPDGTLVVEVGGKRHELVVGAAAPGSGDRYVRYKKDNLVYVIDASIIRDLEGGAGRLSERQQHEFKMADVQKASVASDDGKRDVIRSGTEGRRFWADPSAPEVNVETIGNWLTKVDRLRPIKFVDALPEGASKVVRIDYADDKGALGYLELYRHSGDQVEYYVTSEQLRLPATVAKTVAEQVQDDLASVLGGEAPSSEGSADAEGSAKAEGPPPGGDPHGGALPPIPGHGAPSPHEGPAPGGH